MTNTSRAEYNKEPVRSICEELGEAAVLADLERAGAQFPSAEQKWLAWEWIYEQRLKREEAQSKALRGTARQTMYVAIGTFLVALLTAGLLWLQTCAGS